jgi:hypothetical protein
MRKGSRDRDLPGEWRAEGTQKRRERGTEVSWGVRAGEGRGRTTPAAGDPERATRAHGARSPRNAGAFARHLGHPLLRVRGAVPDLILMAAQRTLGRRSSGTPGASHDEAEA